MTTAASAPPTAAFFIAQFNASFGGARKDENAELDIRAPPEGTVLNYARVRLDQKRPVHGIDLHVDHYEMLARLGESLKVYWLTRYYADASKKGMVYITRWDPKRPITYAPPKGTPEFDNWFENAGRFQGYTKEQPIEEMGYTPAEESAIEKNAVALPCSGNLQHLFDVHLPQYMAEDDRFNEESFLRRKAAYEMAGIPFEESQIALGDIRKKFIDDMRAGVPYEMAENKRRSSAMRFYTEVQSKVNAFITPPERTVSPLVTGLDEILDRIEITPAK